ncbi:MAG: T9SS type A sorting domain-containing protein, partial [Bacteroidales bacterium]|nr:T9SS type A sorting domain-containing protein [Bacteroidales bacterium]
MKKLLFCVLFLFAIAVASYSQDMRYHWCFLDSTQNIDRKESRMEIRKSCLYNFDEDTSNLFLPKVFRYSCMPCLSIGNLNYWYSYEGFDENLGASTADTLFAVRQPYHSDTTISLDGIVFIGTYIDLNPIFRNQINARGNPMYDVDSSFYFQIMDNNDSVIYQVKYDTINDSIKSTCTAPSYNDPRSYPGYSAYQVTFDSIVHVQGDFYVVATFGNWFGRYGSVTPPLRLCLAGMFCDTNEYKYPFPEVQFKGDSSWVNIKDQWNIRIRDMYSEEYKWTNLISMIDIYPRLNTTGYISGSSNIENVDNKEISVDIFPNPANSEVNINCGYKMKTLQVFDEQGKHLFEKEVNAYNYQINLENYPTGTYLIKVLTNSGQTTKK